MDDVDYVEAAFDDAFERFLAGAPHEAVLVLTKCAHCAVEGQPLDSRTLCAKCATPGLACIECGWAAGTLLKRMCRDCYSSYLNWKWVGPCDNLGDE